MAAMQMAEKKVWAQRSYRVAILRQSLSLPTWFLFCAAVYKALCHRPPEFSDCVCPEYTAWSLYWTRHYETSRHHSLYPQEVPWPVAEKRARRRLPCNRSPDRRSDGTLLVDRRHCKQHGVLNSGRLLCVRCIGKSPFFQRTRCCSVGLEMGWVNHQACCRAIFLNKFRKNLRLLTSWEDFLWAVLRPEGKCPLAYG